MQSSTVAESILVIKGICTCFAQILTASGNNKKSHISSIALQLLDVGEDIENIIETTDEKTVASTFALAFGSLSELDLDEIRKNFRYPEIRGFQNRSHTIQAIDDFILSDKTILLLSGGGHYIGKKTVVWHTLGKIQHNKLPLFVYLTPNSDIIRIMEELAVQLGISSFLDVEVLASLKNLPTEKVKSIIAEAIIRLAPKTILILDGFENVIDPNGKIDSEDVDWFIDRWSGAHGANIIIESRTRVEQLPFERCQIEYLSTFKSRTDARYGEYLYIVHLLKELVPTDYRLSDPKFGGFPLDLLESLDNHPYFTYVAGTLIRNNPDTSCLNNPDFITNLKFKIYKNLLSNIGLTDTEKEILYSFTLVKDYFPLKFVDMVTEDSMITKKLLEKGLLIESSPGRFRPLQILRMYNKVIRDRDEKKQIEKKWHLVFANVFQRLYDGASTPSFYRQSYYHATLSGSKRHLISYHYPELSMCADSWFSSKKYGDALWAYQNIQKIRKLHPKEQMRLASCLIRAGEFPEGDALYHDLFTRYRDWHSVKNSYVDSLLSRRGKEKIALKALSKIPQGKREYYWHRQAARCYRRLVNREKTYKEYEAAILDSPINDALSIIHELVNYARGVGDNAKEEEWLDYAWNKLKLRSDAVKLDLGAFYERNDVLEKAEPLLLEVHRADPSNAYCILSLIKTLCKLEETGDARIILEKTPDNVSPHDVFVSAKIAYFKALEQFPECEKLLCTLPMLVKNETSIHRWGQWADLFLSWCLNLYSEEQIDMANRGLRFVNEIIEERNVPAMMSCLELSKIKGDTELQKTLEKTIHEVNYSYF